jgi:hypothetical protein
MHMKRSVEVAPTRPDPADQALPAPIAVSPDDLAHVAAGAAEAAAASGCGSGGTRTCGKQALAE